MDRVNISVTARQMMPAYGLTDQDMGYIFSAFVFGYALCQIPGGWLGDRWGARVVLAGALVWWSLFTALTAVAATLPLAAMVGTVGALIVVRFLLGVGEAVALPNFNRAVADWIPPAQRGLGIGIAIGGIGIGAAITPPLASWVMVNYHWQTVFYLSALIGLVVALLWVLCSREQKAADGVASIHPRVVVPWRQFAASSSLRWLVLSYACLGYVAYIYMSWFYLYLVNVRGIDLLPFAGVAPNQQRQGRMPCGNILWMGNRAWGSKAEISSTARMATHLSKRNLRLPNATMPPDRMQPGGIDLWILSFRPRRAISCCDVRVSVLKK